MPEGKNWVSRAELRRLIVTHPKGRCGKCGATFAEHTDARCIETPALSDTQRLDLLEKILREVSNITLRSGGLSRYDAKVLTADTSEQVGTGSALDLRTAIDRLAVDHKRLMALFAKED